MRRGAEELPWPDDSFDVALAQLVVAFMTRRAGGRTRDAARGRHGRRLHVGPRAHGDALRDQPDARRTRRSREDSPYRSRGEIEELLGEGAESELLEVDADYADFEDFWEALLGGVGPAGAWAAALDDEQRTVARAELFRQLGEPDGPFTMTGRAWAVRVTA